MKKIDRVIRTVTLTSKRRIITETENEIPVNQKSAKKSSSDKCKNFKEVQPVSSSENQETKIKIESGVNL